MGIQLSGVFSGIDSSAMIAQLMMLNSQPLQRTQNNKYLWSAKKTAYTAIESAMSSLRTEMDGLNDAEELKAVTASSSDSDILTSTAESSATEGTYNIEVNQLAMSEREVHTNGVADAEAALGEATFGYTYNGTSRTLQTTAEMSLEGLRDLINNDESNPGVTASILEYDSKHYLVLAGNDEGADYTIDVIDTGANQLAGFGAGTFTETQSAQNCKVKLDGFPVGEGNYMERSSNTLTDLIPDVEINLLSTGTSTVTLRRDTAATETRLSAMIVAFNTLRSTIDKYTGYDEETESGGVLQGETSLNSLFSELRSALLGTPAGFLDESDAYTLAGQIGLEIDDEGVFSLDKSILSDTISDDYLGVLSLIGADKTAVADDETLQILATDDSTVAGTYEIQVSYLADGSIEWAKIRTEGDTEWRDMDVDGTKLTAQVGNDEQGLQLVGLWDENTTPHVQDGVVRVRQGFAGVVYDKLDQMLSVLDGPMALKKEYADEQIEMLDDRIEIQQTRLDRQEKALIAKYSRLEMTMARLDAQTAAYQAMIASLGISY